MEKKQEENYITKDTIRKITLILNQKKEDQIENDLIFKYQLKIFFAKIDDIYEFIFDKGSHTAKIITKIIDILDLVFQMPRLERQKFYDKNIYDVKENNFLNILKEIQKLESFDIIFDNKKLSQLYKIISSALDSKDYYFFSDYINSVFFHLSFLQNLELLLKFQLYPIIIHL